MLSKTQFSSCLLSSATRHPVWLAVLVGIALALFLPLSVVSAAPSAPIDIKLVQPDGTIIAVQSFGDEWYSGYEYEGYTILLDEKSGYWVYASATTTGQLVPGSWKAGVDKRPADLLPGLRDTQAIKNREDNTASISPNAWAGTDGTYPVLVILVDFTPTQSRSTTDAAWSQQVFDATAGVKSVRNFYREASFNKVDLIPATESFGTPNDGVIDVTLGYAHPNTGDSTGTANRQLTVDALTAANAFIDYQSYDTNSNGSLDGTELHLMIVVRGYETSYGGAANACGPNVWGHRGSLSLSTSPVAPTLDGVVVGAASYSHGYSQIGEWHETTSTGCDGDYPGHMATIGIVTHEMGHDIDWPDLYDTDGSSSGVGSWSIMSGGSWGRASGSEFVGTTPTLPDAFLKWYQGWITPTPVTEPTTGVSIPNAAQNGVAYLLGTNPKNIDWDFSTTSGTGEYFLVENRQLEGFDDGLWSVDGAGAASGCLIWHIDESVTYTNSANATEAHKLVDLEEANGTQNLELASGSGGNDGDTGDPWPGSTPSVTFNAASTPGSNWYDGSTSGIAVTNISAGTTGCQVDFSGVGPAWDGSESSAWDTAANWSVERVPNQNDNVVIPAGVSNFPDLNVAGSVYNMNIQNNAHMSSADAVLNVYGNWTETGAGYFDASAGTVVFQGSTDQTITSGAGSHFNHIQIGSGSTTQTVTAASDLDVNGNLLIQPDAKLNAGSHTIQVGGNWTDAPFGFTPGTSTVVLNGTAQTIQKSGTEKVIYSTNFSTTTGWAIMDTNGGGYWGYSTSVAAPNIPDRGTHARYFPNASVAGDDWLFSPGVYLEAGVNYSIRFNYGTLTSSKTEKMAVYVGSTRSAAGMTDQIFDNNNITNTTYIEANNSFTPASSGTYYVGFHCYSDANQSYPAVDDFIVAAPDSDLAFYNLDVAGTVSMDDHTAVANNLTVDAGGALTLGTNTLTVDGAITNNGSLVQTKNVNAANVEFLNIQDSTATNTKYRGVAIDAVANSQNIGDTTVTVRELNAGEYCTAAGGSSPAYARRCYDIAPTTQPLADVRLRLYARTADELNGILPANLSVFHYQNPIWTPLLNLTTGDDGGAYSYVEGDTSGFSAFLMGASGSTPTVMKMQSLTASGTPLIPAAILLSLLVLSGAVLLLRRRA